MNTLEVCRAVVVVLAVAGGLCYAKYIIRKLLLKEADRRKG